MNKLLCGRDAKITAFGWLTILISITLCLPMECFAGNLLSNPGFENGLKDWNPRGGPARSGHCIDEAGQHSGKMSAKISFTEKDSGYFGERLDIPVGTTITFSGYIKTENVSGAGTYLRVFCVNTNGIYMPASDVRSAPVTGMTGWTKYVISATVLEGATQTQVEVFFDESTGTAWYDDFEVVIGKEKLSSEKDKASTINIPKVDKTLQVKKTDVPPVIDGKLDDECWNKAGKAIGFLLLGEEKPATEQTIAYVTYDSNNLYIAFDCKESRLGELQRKTEGHDNHTIARDDCVEIFLNFANNDKTYAHLIINANGAVYDASDGKREDTEWESNATVKTTKGIDSWMVEMAIPFNTLGVAPKSGDVWGINLAREEKPRAENSSWPLGYFGTPDKFGDLVFNPELSSSERGILWKILSLFASSSEKGISWQILSLGDLLVGSNGTGGNEVKIKLKNEKNTETKLNVKLACKKNKEIHSVKTYDLAIDGKTEKEFVLPYQLGGEKGSRLEISIFDANQGTPYYQNDFPVLQPPKPAYFVVNDPLYEELLSDDPGECSLIPMYDTHTMSPGYYRKSAMKYAHRYVLNEQFLEAKENGLLPLIQDEERYDYIKNSGVTNVGFWVSGNYHQSGRQRGAPDVVDGMPYIFDPRAMDGYAATCQYLINQFKNKGLWGIWAGDEQYECACSIVPREKRDNILDKMFRDADIKGKYGFGKFDMPLSNSDDNPFAWIAFRRWVSDNLNGLYRRTLYKIKEENPGIKLVSPDFQSQVIPVDLVEMSKIFDIFISEPLNTLDFNLRVGWITKYLVDLTGKSVWIMPQIGKYSVGALSPDPENIREIFSQIFRNGGTGFIEMSGEWADHELGHHKYTSPERWRAILEIANRARSMNKLKIPGDADTAILVSNDSYDSCPILRSEEAIGETSIPALSGYAILGPKLRAWFHFISDAQLESGVKHLEDYKIIYIPFIKYERLAIVDKIKEYARNGGIVVCADPEAFSWNINGDDISSARAELCGIKLKGKKNGMNSMDLSKMPQKETISLPTYSANYDISIIDADILGRYSDGTPAITSKKYGSGEVFYFAVNPFTYQAIDNKEWIDIFRKLQIKAQAKINRDIWRFKFPEFKHVYLPVPEGYCLTGNSIMFKENNAVEVKNIETDGSYSFSLAPDEGQNNIPFTKGRLTDRKRVSTGKRSEGDGYPKLGEENYIVTFGKTEPVDIIFDLKKIYNISRIKIFYTAQLPDMKIQTSKDGKNWADLSTSKKRSSTLDVLDENYENLKSDCRYVKIQCGKRDDGEKMTLVEVEIWGER